MFNINKTKTIETPTKAVKSTPTKVVKLHEEHYYIVSTIKAKMLTDKPDSEPRALRRIVLPKKNPPLLLGDSPSICSMSRNNQLSPNNQPKG